MPTISERQILIQMVLQTAEQEMDNFTLGELENDSELEDTKMNSPTSNSDLLLLSESSSSSSSASSASLSLSSSSLSSGIQISDMSSDGEGCHTAVMAEMAALLEVIAETRVLNPHKVVKSFQLYLVLVEFKGTDPKRFRQNLRVSPNTFKALLHMIKGDLVFTNKSTVLQLPVNKQLAICLFQFGHNGNAASVEAIVQWAGVSCGTVVKSTCQVMIAFLVLHDSAICWPSEEEKEGAKGWVESVSCPEWQGGFCMVDGTLVPLFEKPGHHGEVYFDRKSNYSLNVQLITLPNLRIIDYVVGHCGSTHDSTVFRDSQTYKRSHVLFGKNEWIWADSAYMLDTWCITPYKKPSSNLAENKTFNYHLSQVCVKSEHAMGYIKGRFCSLQGLQQQIDDSRDHEHALVWVKCCIIIHTLTSIIEEGNEDEDFVAQLVQEGTDVDMSSTGLDSSGYSDRQQETWGQQKRTQLKQQLLNSLEYNEYNLS